MKPSGSIERYRLHYVYHTYSICLLPFEAIDCEEWKGDPPTQVEEDMWYNSVLSVSLLLLAYLSLIPLLHTFQINLFFFLSVSPEAH